MAQPIIDANKTNKKSILTILSYTTLCFSTLENEFSGLANLKIERRKCISQMRKGILGTYSLFITYTT